MFRGDKRLRVITILIIAVSFLTSSSVFASQKDSTKESAKDSSKAQYNTTRVEYGDYVEKSALKSLEWQFTVNDTLTIDEEQGTFGEYLVTPGQEVKKGDNLISYNIPGRSIEIDEKKMQLKQAERDYHNSLNQKNKEIDASYQSLSTMDLKSIDAEILQLNIKKMEIGIEQYEYQTKKSISDLKESIKELEKTMELQYIQAPYDGMVYYRDKIKEGTIIKQDTQLIFIQDLNSAVLCAEASDVKKLWYNMKVSVEGISRMKVNTSSNNTGRIITVDSLFNGKVSTGKVYVQVDNPKELLSVQSANISSESVTIKNVLLIPVKSVKNDNDMQYVFILDDDGVIRKQYITGRDNGTNMWVFSGLSEGQRIVVE